MPPVITAFEASPDRGLGLARDMPVRWAFEETGQAYDVRLMSFQALKQPAHLAIQPFGQIPTYRDGDLALFESGAIVLRIAESAPGLLPADPSARSRAIMWMFCAVATLQPTIVDREIVHFMERDKPWQAERFEMVFARIHALLDRLVPALGDAEWLDGDFSAGDLMIVTVLRRLSTGDILEAYPTLTAYVARAEARPAFQRAFAAQLAVFEAAKSAS